MTDKEAIEALTDKDVVNPYLTLEALEIAIDALKERAERKTGKWIAEEIGLRRYAMKCSVCGIILHEGYNFDNAQEYKKYIDGFGHYDKFCHECGAKMED
ncbi:MAG: hypothetical protein J6U54_16005 [Clostridiales bacterium]|nr:hypothetical protein [Clostridiales bacterium]